MAINKAYLNSGRTKESDECITPRYGVLPIIPYLKERGYVNVACPFDKEDSMYVRVLRDNDFNVVYGHIDEGKDFFDWNFDGVDCIVSNPPFSIKDKVLKRLYETKKPFAILLPQNSLQGKKRVSMFKEYGIEYMGFDGRICFYTNGDFSKWNSGNHFASGYFCKDVLPDKMIFEILNPIQEPYFY